MATDDLLDRGRTAYARMAWREAHDALAAADQTAPLALDDLERLATTCFLIGREEDGAERLARLHHDALAADDATRAARSAFWIGFSLLARGDVARAGGWLARAERVLEDRPESVERGFLLLPIAIQQLEAADWATALATFEDAGAVGERFRNADLTTFARLGRGQALIGKGEVARGLAMLDEAMVAVTAGEVSPFLAGVIYCATVEACHRVFDVRRAQEWTAALDRWIASQPDLTPFRGECLVYRAELLLLHGTWPAAGHEARRAMAFLIGPPPEPAVGDALYQQAELHRLAGRFAEAETAYREASEAGRRPDPGLALLRLAQGRVDAAAASLRRALDETDDSYVRPRLLAALTEVALASDDIEAAERASAELSGLADQMGAPLLHAMAAHAEGSVLARRDPRAGLVLLRRAAKAWQAIDAPYEVARVRVDLGLACRVLGDEDTARLELDAARRAFRELGARPDLERLEAVQRGVRSGAAPGGLTPREVEILQLVAAGGSNRAIATALVISEKTVARHLANIFTKLGLSSRAAATAYAYEHDLVRRATQNDP